MLNARIVGAWDGTHVWLQWDPPSPEATAGEPALYEVRLRFGDKNTGQWEEWQSIRKSRRAWLSLNVQSHAPGALVQADISAGETWERALAAKFVRSLCRFVISSEKKAVHFLKGMTMHAVVDGMGCSYKLREEIEVGAGQQVETEMEALASGPPAQIDRPFDFLLRPGLGVKVTNIEPSRNDVDLMGVDFVELIASKRDGPVALVAVPKQATD